MSSTVCLNTGCDLDKDQRSSCFQEVDFSGLVSHCSPESEFVQSPVYLEFLSESKRVPSVVDVMNGMYVFASM